MGGTMITAPACPLNQSISSSSTSPALFPLEFLTSTTMPCHRSGPRIPKAPLYFESPKDEAYFVMEYIELNHPSLITHLAERTAQSLDWLSGVSAPPEDKDLIGPLGAVSFVIGSSRAPLAFSSIDALERYMNEVRIRHPTTLYLSRAVSVSRPWLSTQWNRF